MPSDAPATDTTYAACWPRRGCPTGTASTSSPTWRPPRPTRPRNVAERRRAVRAEQQLAAQPASRDRDRRDEDDEEAYLQDSGLVVRFLTNPVAVVLALFAVLAVVGARTAFGSITGGALSPVPADVAEWWQLHVQTLAPARVGHPTSPRPAYVLPFAFVASLVGGPGVVVSALMLLAVPFAAWGAWRLLTVVGHLVDTRDSAALAARLGRGDLRPRPGHLGRVGRGSLRHRGRGRAAAVDRPRRPRIRRPRP